MKRMIFRLALLAVFSFCAVNLNAAWTHDIGYVQLSTELGSARPTGTNITVSQIEGYYFGNYFPDTNTAEFAGKTFFDKTAAATGFSLHATTVGKYFYGGSSSIAPDISHVDSYHNGDWLEDGFLRPGATNGEPLVETNRVQNHSWVGGSSIASNYIRRLDYAIDRDGFTCVVGLDNGSNSVLPELLCYTYNGITVGCTDGDHSAGATTNDVGGRVKPDVVSPWSWTSYATPTVGSCAALLMEVADKNGDLSNGNYPQSIKAILLAGATKDEFPAWDRTHARPLDERYGAGELNIYNSYHIMTNGEQTASSTSLVEHMGWDYYEVSASTNLWYFFEIPSNHISTRFSAVLTWHREITNSSSPPFFTPEASMANMNLFMYTATNFTVGTLLDHSTSQVDNVEHIYIEDLHTGRYCFKVTSDDYAEYALAWYSMTAKIPSFDSSVSAYLSATGFSFDVNISPQVPYGVEVTTALVSGAEWELLSTNTLTTSIWSYIDTEATNLMRRYYRAVPDP